MCCHPERELWVSRARQILRCAQDDRTDFDGEKSLLPKTNENRRLIIGASKFNRYRYFLSSLVRILCLVTGMHLVC
jgi:hypothetical protein